MAGICGTAGYGGLKQLQVMLERIMHRGPDGTGYFTSQEIFLANCRLAISDIEGGKQPVYNEDKSIVAVFNGEIYNFRPLRKMLLQKNHEIISQCDSEVIPHLFEENGPDFVNKLRGMFAIALYNKKERVLYLYRDPAGIKPLFYTTYGSTLSFASEAKSLFVTPNCRPALNPGGLHMLINIQFIPGRETLFKNVYQLLPGERLAWHGGKTEQTVLRDLTKGDPGLQLGKVPEQEIWDYFKDVVAGQLNCDLPMGVGLSGSLYSSAITAAMGHGIRTKTFTVGFGEHKNELVSARAVADYFTTDHREINLKPDPFKVMDRAVFFCEVPKINSLQRYYVYENMSKYVKVAFSGIGGDELFCGYDIYDILLKAARYKRMLGDILGHMVMQPTSLAFNMISLFKGLRGDLTRRKGKFLENWQVPVNQYLLLRSCWDMGLIPLQKIYTTSFAGEIIDTTSEYFEKYFLGRDMLEKVAIAEFKEKMVNDLLWNEDRMSMAHSVEARVPFLDFVFAEMCFNLDIQRKLASGAKGFLRSLLKDILPEQTFKKPKWDFTFNPVEQFKKDLRPLAKKVLTEKCVKERGVFNWNFINRILNSKPHPDLRWHYYLLWQMVGLEYWLKGFVEGEYFKKS
jgi:asparagine synthase (glutamine-hydrolysing)